jgi:chromosome segregation ATPase
VFVAQPKSLNEIQQQLQDSQRDMEEQLDKLQRREQRLDADIDNAEAALVTLQGQAREASSQFEYFQGVRDHVSDLCFCLREKEPMLEQLHATVGTIRAHRASSRRQRRAQDLEDELDELSEAGALVSAQTVCTGSMYTHCTLTVHSLCTYCPLTAHSLHTHYTPLTHSGPLSRQHVLRRHRG